MASRVSDSQSLSEVISSWTLACCSPLFSTSTSQVTLSDSVESPS